MQTTGNARTLRRLRSHVAVAALVMAGLLEFASGPGAQAPAVQASSPFDIIGFIQAATIDNPADVFSGGTITVNGTTIIVPRNSFLQMPAFGLMWQEVFGLAPAPWGPTQSGLAIADVPRPPQTYEVHVMGNRVSSGGADQHIAGLLFLSQLSLNAGAGFINDIDYAAGELRVGGAINDRTTGARVRINDPIGRYTGRPNVSPDVRFTVDEDNPTVRSETAYPMCLPLSDPALGDDPNCPRGNRPRDFFGNYQTIIEFPPPDVGVLPDATRMMPFEVGDYVTYSGNVYNDAAGQPYIAAWSVIANIGAFTAPGWQPAYVAIDVQLLGVGGVPIPGLPQEAAVRTRVEGFTTDPALPIEVFAIDVDPCSGNEADRFYALVEVDPGPPNGAVRGRWRWRPKTEAAFLPPTREIRAVSLDGIVDTPVANGLNAGQYHAPTFAFIPPENLGIGNPPVPINFQDFPFLAEGSGPYPGPAAPRRIGQLAPWPGATPPPGVVCSASGGTVRTLRAPVADAGLSQTVASRAIVTLDGNASADTNTPPLPLSFDWAQTSGPAVVLAGAKTPVPSFTAPAVAPGAPNVTLVFALTVRNTAGLPSVATTTVTVGNTAPPVDTLTVTATFRIRRSQLFVTAITSNPTAILSLKGFGVMPRTIPPAPGDFTMRIVGVNPPPASVTVTSNLGASVTVPVTVRP